MVLLCLGAILLSPSESLLAQGTVAASGEAMLREFLREEIEEIRARAPAGFSSRDGWERARAERRDELKEMLGLLPEPPRGDLHPVITGVIERPDLGIAVEKLHFQSLSDLYVTGNLYRPLHPQGRLPAILYLCGHGQVKLDGVPYGAKAYYQHHPGWFARNGYVALVIDTLQFGEIEGIHHGTYRLGMWWWVSRGYTPAGVEAWNSIRALDYLESRPDVDRARLGVTGRSGGGIGSWWLGALDDRPRALVPVAGITDLENHLLDNRIDGHCDCNFPVNLYRWDFPRVATLCAPRPLLHANSDRDEIFPLSGVMRLHGALREAYALLGPAPGKPADQPLGLVITPGPHEDTPELQLAAFRWMGRWLGGKTDGFVTVPAEKLFDPRELRVFDALPAGARNTTIHETFVPAAPSPEAPRDRAAFELWRARTLAELRRRTFRNQPDPERPLELEERSRKEREGILLRGYRFRSERSFRLPLWVLSRAGEAAPARLRVRVVDGAGWSEWTAKASGLFAEELALPAPPAAPVEGARGDPLLPPGEILAIFPPRGIGPTRWIPSAAGAPADPPPRDAPSENGIGRRFLALGRTVEEARVLDVRRALRALAAAGIARDSATLEAEGEMAGVALYAAILEPAVGAVDLRRLPASHRDGVPLLNVLRVLDLPQSAALLFPRKVILREVPESAFAWTRAAAKVFEDDPAVGGPVLRIEPSVQTEKGR